MRTLPLPPTREVKINHAYHLAAYQSEFRKTTNIRDAGAYLHTHETSIIRCVLKVKGETGINPLDILAILHKLYVPAAAIAAAQGYKF